MLNFEHSEHLIAKHSVISAGPCSEPFMDFIGISKINVLFYIAFFCDSSVPKKAEQQKLSTSPRPVYFYHWLLWEAIVIQCGSRKFPTLLFAAEDVEVLMQATGAVKIADLSQCLSKHLQFTRGTAAACAKN